MNRILPQKYGLRPPECAAAVGSMELFNEMKAAGWISPVVQRHKITLYDAGDLAKCWARILNGEVPQ